MEYELDDKLFSEYKNYMLERSFFKDVLKIYPNTPDAEVQFPTIIMRELNNSDYSRGKTTDRTEYVDSLTYRVSVYIKPIIIGQTKYTSKEIMNEIKKLTHNFFRNTGFERTSDRRVDNIDISVLRREMTFTAKVASWNNSLYF